MNKNISSPYEFSEFSIRLTKSLSKIDKKEQGIFFTPPDIAHKLIQECLQIKTPTTVLEPSAGSGEFIRVLDTVLSGAQIVAVEKNTDIFNCVSNISTSNPVEWIHSDFTHYSPLNDAKFDWIVGNPPYVVVGKDSIPDKYAKYMTGRPNIFGLFIVHSISMLSPDGILAFIVPKSFLNAGYYSLIRNYMKQTGRILKIIDFETNGGFIDTNQSTIGFIYQKTAGELAVECGHSLRIGDNYVFLENAGELRELFRGSTTLHKMGLFVKTGNVVWNQKKPLLTSDPTNTLLLYNSNISKDNTIRLMDFQNDEKKQYIQMPGTRDTVIIVNRGNGNSAYKHTYALVDGNTQPYLAENHLNVIYSETLSGEEKRILFERILISFKDPRTEQFIRTFLGNNGLSKTELETIFPIFI